MRRLAPLIALALAACQQSAAPADDTESNGVATTEPASPLAESPGTQPAASEPAAIPANFRGLWADSQTACGQLSHPSRLVIADRTVRYPSFVLSAESVGLPSDGSVTVKGRNANTKAAAEAHFSLDETGSILTDGAGGGAVRVRCG